MITRPRIKPQHMSLVATTVVFLLLYGIATLRYPGFASWFQTTELIATNAPLGLAAIGMTFVILSGGIDLSVGAVIALSSILLAKCLTSWNLPVVLAIPAVLSGGALFGTASGLVIRWFRLPPFLVTLAAMFLARGVALVLTEEKRLSIAGHATFDPLVDFLFFGFNLPALFFLAAILLAIGIARYSRFGRNVYAIGGSAPSALLMGLPVGRTTVMVYALSGLCAAGGGILYAISSQSGDASSAQLLELDAIAAVVIGGTLLSGGVGSVAGTFLGVLILGVITVVPVYEGNLNSWWTKIAIGGLLLAFIVLQQLLQRSRN